MSTQLVKRNGKSYDQFKDDNTFNMDEFEYDFNLDNIEVQSFEFTNGEVRNLSITDIQVEDYPQYVVVGTADLQKIFVDEPVDLNLDSLKQAVEDVLQDTLTLRSDKNLGRPDILIRSCLANQITDQYVKLVNSLKE